MPGEPDPSSVPVAGGSIVPRQEDHESRALPREAAAAGFGFLVFVARFTLVALG